MPTTCEITLENVDSEHYSGQLFKGTAELTIREVKKNRGMFARFFGRAHTDWPEWCNVNHGINPLFETDGATDAYHVMVYGINQTAPNEYQNLTKGHSIHFSSEEIYFNETVYLLGEKDGGEVK